MMRRQKSPTQRDFVPHQLAVQPTIMPLGFYLHTTGDLPVPRLGLHSTTCVPFPELIKLEAHSKYIRGRKTGQVHSEATYYLKSGPSSGTLERGVLFARKPSRVGWNHFLVMIRGMAIHSSRC